METSNKVFEVTLFQILFFLIKSPNQHLKFFRRLATFLAHFSFLLGRNQNFSDLFAHKFGTFSAHFHAVFLCTRKQHKAAHGTAAAARAFYLVVADDAVAPAYLMPKNGGFVQFFVGFGKKSRTNRAVVPAHGNNRLGAANLLKLFNVPLHISRILEIPS